MTSREEAWIVAYINWSRAGSEQLATAAGAADAALREFDKRFTERGGDIGPSAEGVTSDPAADPALVGKFRHEMMQPDPAMMPPLKEEDSAQEQQAACWCAIYDLCERLGMSGGEARPAGERVLAFVADLHRTVLDLEERVAKLRKPAPTWPQC